ncbi:MAG TPA: EAL domain-containing protein [Acidimicrobiia bacterium]|nr:EAL domain-containing protein [Acidimicrobiia bacterium]
MIMKGPTGLAISESEVSESEVASERRLSDLLSEFARTLLTDFPIQGILDHLVVRIAEVLPIGSVGVTLISDEGEARHVAASDESALRFVKLQTELGEGPCLTAHRTGETVVVPDLRSDDRFPEFSRRALEEGLRAVFSFPLQVEGHQLGALDLYRQTAGPMDAEAMETAQTLADVTTAYLLNAETRADLEASSERAHHNSLHDPLTGLPNRTLFVQRLDHAMLRARRSEKLVAVFFADLDQFKAVNDTFGHQVGDELLIAVADRLSDEMRPGDTLARLSGDEFVILCEDLDDVPAVEPLAARIAAALAEPFILSDSEITVRASVGIAFAGFGDDVPERVLEEADAAMYQVKRGGGGRHAVIDLREHRSANHRARLNRDLRGALRREELSVQFQPVVATSSGQVVGAEALLRWDHPAYGPVDPAVLIPLAEQSGAIIDIGRWVLERACIDGLRWLDKGLLPAFGISVNVSVRQLMATEYVASVASVLRDTGIDPGHVTLELTESVLVHDEDRALSVLRALKRLGVNIAVDDFGTGLSSLSRLKQFPVDIVKIDREFVIGLEGNLASRLIVGAVVGLAHGLEMKVVAEGIETVGQRDEVAELGCDFSQGFYFARPQPADAIEALLSISGPLPRLRSLPGLDPHRATPAGNPSGASAASGTRSAERT